MGTSQYQLSEYLDGLDLARVIADLTGYQPDLALDVLFDQAGIVGAVDRLKDIIMANYDNALRAAFVAGAVAGLNPERLLLARLSSAVKRLEDAVDRLGGES